MPDKPDHTLPINSTITKPPRKQARLDHWVGPMQSMGDGVSTDPAMVTPKGGVQRRRSQEPPLVSV